MALPLLLDQRATVKRYAKGVPDVLGDPTTTDTTIYSSMPIRIWKNNSFYIQNGKKVDVKESRAIIKPNFSQCSVRLLIKEND